MEFEIEMVHAGWAVFRFGQVEVWASAIWDHDSPKQLLKMLARSLAGEGAVLILMGSRRSGRCPYDTGLCRCRSCGLRRET